MEFLIKIKLASIAFIGSILSSPIQTFIATASIFIFSILISAFCYKFLYHYHQANIIRYKSENLIGFTTPLPAFKLASTLKVRAKIEAKNDLRLSSFVGETTTNHWSNFNQDNSLERQFPNEKGRWQKFKDIYTRGVTPNHLIEKTFPKYGLLEIQILKYRDNSFDILFPIQVMQEYFEVKSVENLQERMRTNQLNSHEKQLFDALKIVAPKIRQNILEKTDPLKLFWLSSSLKDYAEVVAKDLKDIDRFKNIFYGLILSTLTPSSTNIKFNFNTLQLIPNIGDFFYISSTLATLNYPTEIVPLTTSMRVFMWLQLMFSYFLLALNVAALLKLINL